MLKEHDAYGAYMTPEKEAEIARETEMELLSEMEVGPDGEPPTVGMKIDKRTQTVTLYDRLTDEVLFHTSIVDYDRLLEEREIRRRAGGAGKKED